MKERFDTMIVDAAGHLFQCHLHDLSEARASLKEWPHYQQNGHISFSFIFDMRIF